MILQAINLIGLLVVQCDSSMITRIKRYDGTVLNIFTYRASNDYYDCKQSHCSNNRAYCTDTLCCECRCYKNDFLISISEGCVGHRTWNDAGAHLDGKIVPLITYPTDLEKLKITVPKVKLNSRCSVAVIHYYESLNGGKRLLINNPPEAVVVFKTNNGHGQILVSSAFEIIYKYSYCLSDIS